MKFEEALPHLRAGRRIQRVEVSSGWDPQCVYNPVGYPKPFTRSDGTYSFGDLRREDILADDWEVYPGDLPPKDPNKPT